MSAGIPASELPDDALERELGQLHETRHAILLSGTADQLANHVARTHELEHAYLERFGDRVPEAEAKIEALHAHEGERRIKGSVTEPLARGEHSEHGWQADAPDLDGAEDSDRTRPDGSTTDPRGAEVDPEGSPTEPEDAKPVEQAGRG
ncbi:MAG: DUF6158 family protein [Jatrophihabitans sp.]|uniref:DUF6158 family protein n=1 Tax=Jatrophihabitans sp. TaxID=1932789 RepID=UPI003F80DD04